MKIKDEYIQKLVDPGIPYMGEAAGAAIASTVGFFVFGGPAGAAVGATAGKIVTDLFSRAGEEIEKKYLSRRESARIGIVAVYAMNRIKSNFENNKQIRTDDFFERDPIIDRSAADEILEGTLIAAKNEHEEKKLKYYGNLVANIAFHPEIDRYHANYLLRVSERLSYRQICILAILKRKSNYHLISKISGLKTLSSQNDKIILREIREMNNSDLIIPTNNYSTSVGTAANLTPSTIELIEAGKTIHEMMNLDEIDGSEIDRLAAILSDPI
jgi:hypothetical protein